MSLRLPPAPLGYNVKLLGFENLAANCPKSHVEDILRLPQFNERMGWTGRGEGPPGLIYFLIQSFFAER